MGLDFIHFDGEQYLSLQAEGNAARWVTPFAKQFCIGKGCDIGCNRKEWALEGAIPIDPIIDPKYDCMNLPAGKYDYFFSSHMLEHIDDWVACLDYWYTKLKNGGVVFLYLPHYSQKYWRPWNNRKHKHIHRADVLADYFTDRGWVNIFAQDGYDYNNSFVVYAQKPFNLSSIGVYQIINKFNGKRYIGCAISAFIERFRGHKSLLKLNKHHSYLLQRSYNKYGLEGFKFEILEEMEGCSEVEIHERETYYIDLYNSADSKKGFNIKKQSQGNSREVYLKLLLHDINGNLLGEYNSSAEISKIIGVGASTIQGSYKRQSRGEYSSIKGKWIVIKKSDIDIAVFEYPYTIFEIDESGQEIDSFYKYADAGKKFNVSRGPIREWINKNKPTPSGTFLVLKNRKYGEDGTRTGDRASNNKVQSDIPTGHYPVKDSLLTAGISKATFINSSDRIDLTENRINVFHEIIKPLNEYNAGDRITETEYLLLKERPFYNDRIAFSDDTKPEETERYYIIKAIKR